MRAAGPFAGARHDRAVSPRPRTLRDLYAATGSVASVYFGLRAGGDQVFTRWHAVAEALSRQGAGLGLVGMLRAGILGAVPGRGVLVTFAAESRILLSVVMPEASAPARARYGLPHLLPLLAWLQGRPADVVALLGRPGEDIVVHPGGAAADLGGERVVEVSVPLWRRQPSQLLITADDPRAWRIGDGSCPARTGRTASLLAALDEETRPGGPAVVGAGATLDALARGRVRTLLLADDTAGIEDAGSARTAWYGPATADLALEPEALRGLGAGWPARGRLVDVATRAALGSGAQVHVLPTETSWEIVPKGIAALCRHP